MRRARSPYDRSSVLLRQFLIRLCNGWSEAVESVLAQAYENWELVLVDDASTGIELLSVLPRVAALDQRIVVSSLGKHGGISAASNHGIALARGEWIIFLDHDDVLEPDALFHIAKLCKTILRST